MTHQAYVNYYTRQAGGGGLNVFRGSFNQRGHGLGNILGSVFRQIKPLALQGLKAVGRQVLRGGLNTVQDVLQGVPVKRAVTRRATDTVQHLIDQVKQPAVGHPAVGRTPRRGRTPRGGTQSWCTSSWEDTSPSTMPTCDGVNRI